MSAVHENGPGTNDVELTVVVAVHDEEAGVGALAAEIDAAFARVEYGWECVWVDDGSRDGTLERLKRLGAPHRFLALDGNHGQSAAIVTGFRSARGTWVATLDGDGQNEPADLPPLLQEALDSGSDMVQGYRATRHDSFVRRIGSRIANGYRNWRLGETVRDVGCSTRVARRSVLLELPFFHGMHRFLPVLVRMQGHTVREVPVHHRPRATGRSHYGLLDRLFPGLRDVAGVRWLMSRSRRWRIVESGEGDPEP